MSKNRSDTLGDRLKAYEAIETSLKFPPNTYLYVRIDGRSFSKFTRGLKRPYDERLSELMQVTTAALVAEFKATIGYTQSDEISLIIENSYDKGCIFEAKKQKLISTITSFATSVFLANLPHCIPEKDPMKNKTYPSFDCRIFPLNSQAEAANAILWREHDAIKNSISMSAHHYFSHKQLQGIKADVMKDMLKTQKDVIWDDYPKFFKSGTFFKRQTYFKDVDGVLVKRSRICELKNSLINLDHNTRVMCCLGAWEIDESGKGNIGLSIGNPNFIS